MPVGRKWWFLAAGITVVATTAAGACCSEPTLQRTYELTPPSERRPDDTERALLRLEWKAAQSSVDETAAVRELIERTRQMSATSAELQNMIISAPAVPPDASAPAPAQAPPPPPTSIVTSASAAADQAAEAGDETDNWLRTAGGVGIAALVGLWWLTRRQLCPSDATQTLASPTIALPSLPGDPVGGRRQREPAEPTDRETWPAEPDPNNARTFDEGELSLKLADIMLSMGQTQGATRTLEEHVKAHPHRAMHHWLKLLDVYRRAGLRAEFDQAADRLCRQFNVTPPEWLPEEPQSSSPSLESYPHLRKRVVDLWPNTECEDYLQHLLEDNRDGTRTGLTQPVVEEILLLLSILRDHQTGFSISTN